MTTIATTVDPDGRTVVLDADAWHHITRADGHPEMAPLQAAILRAVRAPDERRPGKRTGQEWFYLSGVGPSRWIKVVVAFTEGRGRIITAFPRRSFP